MGEFQTVSVFFCVLAGFVLIALFLGVRERKRSRETLRKRLRSEFGRPSSKKTSPERYAQIPQYYLHHREGFQVDDITWNDLDMDQLFSRMDSTCSAAGEEYLYYLLRTPAMDAAGLPFTQDQYDFFAAADHEKERLRLKEILAGLGRAGRYSLYDYLDLTLALENRGNFRHYAAAAAPFAAFALMFWNTGAGLLLMLLVFAWNLSSYFKEKAQIAPHFQVFHYILRLLDCAGEIEKAGCPVFSKEMDRIPVLLQDFSAFRRGSSLLLGSTAGGSDPFGIILEYIRILFHLDLIKFNSMLEQLRGRQDQISELLTITGRIDSCISIASWRETLPHSAVPAFFGTDTVPAFPGKDQDPSQADTVPASSETGEDAAFPVTGQSRFFAEGLFHPLLEEPVCNGIRTDRPVLLTGSNASGKSTFLKAAALCALLAQTVGIAPAQSYRGGFFRIYSSMALRDSLQDGESYFIVEIKSLRRILEAAETDTSGRNPVLCCIDEVLRGTNTVERIAASAEILRCFARSGTLCLAATHDLELTGLLADVYENYHFGEEIEEGDVRFSYRLLPGPSTSCNAIALLAFLGYDPALVQKARDRADRFLESGRWK